MTSGAAFAANLARDSAARASLSVFIAVMVLINYFLVITWFPRASPRTKSAGVRAETSRTAVWENQTWMI